MFNRSVLFIGLSTSFSGFVQAIGSSGSSNSNSNSGMLGGGTLPFATFDANNHSYAFVFSSVISGIIEANEDHCNGRLHNAPAPLYNDIVEGCKSLGEIVPTIEPTRPTNQLLVASHYYNCGQDYIYVDTIDKGDKFQRCVQDLKKAAIDRGFAVEKDAKGKDIPPRFSGASPLNLWKALLGVLTLCMSVALAI